LKTALLIGLLFGVLCTTAVAVPADGAVQVAIVIPRGRHGERALSSSARNERFHVTLTNSSDKPTKIWKEWCSWGYYALSFELTDESGKTWTAKKKPRSWDQNYPDYWTIDPHESLVLDVEIAGADIWEGFPRPSRGSQKLRMRAVFEIRPDHQSQEHSVWTGRAISKPDDYVFYR
jgi:hypothetical protein